MIDQERALLVEARDQLRRDHDGCSSKDCDALRLAQRIDAALRGIDAELREKA